MERNNFIFCLLIYSSVLLLYSGCQEQSKVEGDLKSVQAEAGTPDSNQPTGKIKFEKVVLDFGEVGPGAKSTEEVKFTNIGEGVLKITEVGQCCGVVATVEKNEYSPGESGVLKVIYVSSEETGAFKKPLVISTNDRTDPDIILTIKADIIPKIAWKPDKLTLFLDEENAACPQLTINSLDNLPFAITGIRSPAYCITTDYDPTVKATEFTLDLKVDMEKIQQNKRGSINFLLTHPEGKTAFVPYSVSPKYTLDQQMLFLFNAEEQKPITKTIKVLTHYNEEFEIESIESRDDNIRVIKNNKIENGYSLDLDIIPPAKEGKIQFSDVLYINIKGGEKLSVTCTGYYIRGKSSVQTR